MSVPVGSDLNLCISQHFGSVKALLWLFLPSHSGCMERYLQLDIAYCRRPHLPYFNSMKERIDLSTSSRVVVIPVCPLEGNWSQMAGSMEGITLPSTLWRETFSSFSWFFLVFLFFFLFFFQFWLFVVGVFFILVSFPSSSFIPVHYKYTFFAYTAPYTHCLFQKNWKISSTEKSNLFPGHHQKQLSVPAPTGICCQSRMRKVAGNRSWVKAGGFGGPKDTSRGFQVLSWHADRWELKVMVKVFLVSAQFSPAASEV